MATVQSRRSDALPSLLDGFIQGAALFILLLAAEAYALRGEMRSVLGWPGPVIALVYILFGGVVGMVCGAVAWLVFLVRRVAPHRLSLVLIASASVGLFFMRDVEWASVKRLLPAVLVVGCGLLVGGYRWSAGAEPDRSRTRRLFRFAGTCATLVVCASLVLWVPLLHHRIPSSPIEARADAPNIVFILVDALRPDRLSAYGYARPTSPTIKRLADEGTVFTNAYSHGNRTIIAMPSLFTSIYPSYARAISHSDWNVPLPDSAATLAEVCRANGYVTMAMMSNPYLKQPFGLTQGFQRTEEFNSGRFHLTAVRILTRLGVLTKPDHAEGRAATATAVTDAAISWIGRSNKSSPYFCYVHYMDVHHPYIPPPRYEREFRSNDQAAQIDPAALFTHTVNMVREKVQYPLSVDELTRLSDLYDGCIRYVDDEIKRLVDYATEVNDRPTIVVFTSDHGDEFQEHGCLYHTNVVIEELIRVPLIVWRSDREIKGAQVAEVVRHVDVLPTVTDWIGAEASSLWVGRSLSPWLSGSADPSPRSLVVEGDFCQALIEPGWKFMRVDTASTEALYELGTDPCKQVDMSGRNADRVARMSNWLDLYLESAPQPSSSVRLKADAATLKHLRALGYLN